SIEDRACYTCAKTSQPFPPPTAVLPTSCWPRTFRIKSENGNLLSFVVVLSDVSPANTQRVRQPRLTTPYNLHSYVLGGQFAGALRS
ncbi:hypothetical protein Bbelb_106410, partial [Branchiostoma belcheri]